MIQRKLSVIAENPLLQQHIGEMKSLNEDIVVADTYTAICCDITNLEDLRCKLEQAGVDFSAPSLFVSECVLTYIDPERYYCVVFLEVYVVKITTKQILVVMNMTIVNPRRTCAARVTVLGLCVCLCVCVCVFMCVCVVDVYGVCMCLCLFSAHFLRCCKLTRERKVPIAHGVDGYKPGMQLCVGLVSLVSSPGTPLLSHQLGGVLSGNETMTSCTLMLLGLASRLGIRYPNSPLRV